MPETDPTPNAEPTEEKKTSSKRSPKPRPIDTLAARMEGAEAVAEWARQTAVGAAMIACLCILAIVALAWRLRGSLGLSAPAVPVPAPGLA